MKCKSNKMRKQNNESAGNDSECQKSASARKVKSERFGFPVKFIRHLKS